jgi:hypothetical protein
VRKNHKPVVVRLQLLGKGVADVICIVEASHVRTNSLRIYEISLTCIVEAGGVEIVHKLGIGVEEALSKERGWSIQRWTGGGELVGRWGAVCGAVGGYMRYSARCSVCCDVVGCSVCCVVVGCIVR